MKRNQPYFSIIIPTLNEEKYLPRLLENLVSQTFKNFELIIVDGHSEDKTVVKAKKFENNFKKLKILTSPRRNVSFQRNLGASVAKSDWLIFLDADDQIPAYFLQGVKYRSESLKTDFFTTWMESDLKDSVSKTVATLLNLFIEAQQSTKKPYVFESFMAVKKDTFLKLGGFDPRVPVGEGNKLLEKAAKKNKKFRIVKDPKYIYSYRRITANGSLRHFLKVARIEIARLTDMELTEDQAKKLYPMEGGTYFKLNPKNTSWLKKVYYDVIKFSK